MTETVGYLESHPKFFSQMEGIGIPAHVWDTVIQADYNLPNVYSTPIAFDWVLISFRDETDQIEFARPKGVDDTAFARVLLRRSEERLKQLFPDIDPGVPSESSQGMAALIELGEAE